MVVALNERKKASGVDQRHTFLRPQATRKSIHLYIRKAEVVNDSSTRIWGDWAVQHFRTREKLRS
jgi:hypothetical protein